MAFKILSTMLLAAGLLMAQKGGGKGGGGGGNNMPSMGPARVEPLDQLAQMLKLNKDQKKDVRGILDETQKEVTPLRDNMIKSREQIAADVEAGKGQDEIDQAVKSYSGMEAQVTTLEAKAFGKIFSSLEADQKTNQQALVGSLNFLHEVFKRKTWNALATE
jgi:hypothetical protein